MSPSKRLTCGFIAVGGFFSSQAVAVGHVLPPPGFEHLVLSRDALVQVRFLGKSLGYHMVSLSPDFVTFTDPAVLIAALPLVPSVREEAESKLRDIMRTPLLRHEMTQCGKASDANDYLCGVPATAGAAVLYDETNDTVDLYVNKSWVVEAPPRDALLVPTEGVRRALVNSQRLSVARTKRSRTYAADFASTLGVSERSFLASNYAFYGEDQRDHQHHEWRLHQLYYRYDLSRQHYAQIGRMDSSNLSSPMGGTFSFSLLPINTIDGFRVGSTRAYLGGDVPSKRTPVSILMARPGRVDVFRGERLLGSFYLGVGAQLVDTSSFPTGSYAISLRVVEDGEIIRTESLPFSRVDGGPGSPGDFQWFGQIGRGAGTYYGQAEGMSMVGGVKLSLTEKTEWSLGVAGKEGKGYAESRLDWTGDFLGGRLAADAGVVGSTDGSYGDNQNLIYSNGIWISLGRESKRAPNCRTGNFVLCGEVLRASLGTNIYGWSLNTAYEMRKSSRRYQQRQFFRDWTKVPFGPEPLWRDPSLRDPLGGHWVAEHTKANRVSLSIARSFRFGRLTVSPNLNVYHTAHKNQTDRGAYVSVSLSHSAFNTSPRGFDRSTSGSAAYNQDGRVKGMRYDAQHSWSKASGVYRNGSVSVSGSDDGSRGISTYQQFVDKWGSASVGVERNYSRYDHSNSFSGSLNYSGAFALNKDGLFWGRDRGVGELGAGVAVSVAPSDHDDDEDRAVVRVGDQGLKYGERFFVPVDVFRESTVAVSDPSVAKTGGVAAVTMGGGMRKWVILPGHVGTHAVSATVIYTFVGRVRAGLDTNRSRGAAARLLDGGTILDAAVPNVGVGGLFAVDLARRPTALHVLKERQLYVCPLPVQHSDGPVQRVGTLSCEPIDASALPAQLAESNRVKRLLSQARSVVSSEVAPVRLD